MANIRHDKRTFVDENKFVSAKLHQGHPRVHSVKKKQVFGELKNVMHNQIGVTPMKGNFNLDSNKGAKCNDGGLGSKKICIPNEGENNKFTMDPVELFDLIDFPKSCCTNSCTKSTEEIWAECDEVALLKAIKNISHGSPITDFDEKPNDIEQCYEDEEDYIHLLSKSVKSYLYLEDYDNGDFSSCSAELPKFEFFNDMLLQC